MSVENLRDIEIYLFAVLSLVTLWLIVSTIRYYKGKKRLFKHMKRFAKEGDTDAQLYVADEYRKGDVVKKSCENARFWYHKAALDGSDEARKRLEKFSDRSELRC